MRDIALTIIVMGLLPYILMRPQVGVFAWSWLGYMNPHRLTYGFAFSFPFAQIVAITTLISILLYKEPKKLPKHSLMVFWILFLLWMLITTVFAMFPEHSWPHFEKVLKIQLVTFLTILVIKTKKDLDILIWIIALSIGFYGIKGGVFTIKTLGAFRVWGPSGTYIEDNNSLSVATLMVLPLFYYLRNQTTNYWLRMFLLVSMVLMVVSAIGSYSRSGLLAAISTGLFLWWKTKSKLLTGIAILFLAIGIFAFMPDAWHERMDTIINYHEEGSALSRLTAWEMSINLANHQVFGGGFNMWSPIVYKMYSPDPDAWEKTIGAHSIYFTVVGEHGWIGLILFFSIYFSGWRLASKVIRMTRGHAELKWILELSQLLQVSLIAYASGGAFLNLTYFDLPWHILSIILILNTITQDSLSKIKEVQRE